SGGLLPMSGSVAWPSVRKTKGISGYRGRGTRRGARRTRGSARRIRTCTWPGCAWDRPRGLELVGTEGRRRVGDAFELVHVVGEAAAHSSLAGLDDGIHERTSEVAASKQLGPQSHRRPGATDSR